jgi:hypothetical protein
VYTHELAHRFVALHFPRAPLWLNEGIAEYLSTLRATDGKIELGLFPSRRRFHSGGTSSWVDGMEDVNTLELPSVKQLVTSSDAWHDPDKMNLYYAGAWLLVHMMYNEASYRDRLPQYYTELYKRDAVEAWNTVYGKSPVEDDYRSYMTAQIMNHSFKSLRAPAEPIPPPALRPVVALSPAQASLMFAAFERWYDKDGRAKAKAEVDAARAAAAPTDSDARYWLARYQELSGDRAGAQQVYDQLIAAGKGGATPILALLEHPQGLSEARLTELGALLRKQPMEAEVLHTLARIEPREAGKLLTQCLKLNPIYFPCLETAAEVEFNGGRAGSAVELQELAIKMLPHGMRSPSMEKQLQRYKAAVKK